MRKHVISGLAGAAALLLAGCSSSGSAGGGGTATAAAKPGSVRDALRQVHGAAAAQAYVEFGDVAGTFALLGGPSEAPLTGPFAQLIGYGAPEIAPVDRLLPDKTGIDLFHASSALAVGSPPNQVGVLYGSFDTAGIGTKLKALGYQKHDLGGGETAWVIRDDHKIDANGPLGGDLGILAQLNVIHLSASRLVYAGATSDIDQELGGKPTLADDAVYAGIGDCLGPAKAATIATDSKSWPKPFGIGVTATSLQDEQEVLCVPMADDAAATAAASAWPNRVNTAVSLKRQEPWSATLTAPKAKVIGGPAHIVQLTAHAADEQRVGSLLKSLTTEDLGSLLGPSSG